MSKSSRGYRPFVFDRIGGVPENELVRRVDVREWSPPHWLSGELRIEAEEIFDLLRGLNNEHIGRRTREAEVAAELSSDSEVCREGLREFASRFFEERLNRNWYRSSASMTAPFQKVMDEWRDSVVLPLNAAGTIGYAVEEDCSHWLARQLLRRLNLLLEQRDFTVKTLPHKELRPLVDFAAFCEESFHILHWDGASAKEQFEELADAVLTSASGSEYDQVVSHREDTESKDAFVAKAMNAILEARTQVKRIRPQNSTLQFGQLWLCWTWSFRSRPVVMACGGTRDEAIRNLFGTHPKVQKFEFSYDGALCVPQAPLQSFWSDSLGWSGNQESPALLLNKIAENALDLATRSSQPGPTMALDHGEESPEPDDGGIDYDELQQGIAICQAEAGEAPGHLIRHQSKRDFLRILKQIGCGIRQGKGSHRVVDPPSWSESTKHVIFPEHAYYRILYPYQIRSALRKLKIDEALYAEHADR